MVLGDANNAEDIWRFIVASGGVNVLLIYHLLRIENSMLLASHRQVFFPQNKRKPGKNKGIF